MITCDIGISVDGYSAGPNQSLDRPMGEGTEHLHRWRFEESGVNRAVIDEIVNARAFIMGRNMFAPGRGEWDLEWRGWWGEEPPYHAPVFVLTHFAREPLELEGTTFTFVTGGPEEALALARAVPGEGNISIAGGASTVRQYLRLGAIEELRLHVAPVIVGAGERPLDDVGPLGLEQLEVTSTPLVTHVRYRVSR